MPESGFIPWPVFSIIAVATVFTVMFAIGVAMDVRDLRWALSQPALLARSLFSVFVVVPVVAVLIAVSLGLSPEAQIGIALIARRRRSSGVRAGAATAHRDTRRRDHAAFGDAAELRLRHARRSVSG